MKEKIRSKEKTIGMHLNLNDVAISRMAGLAGYDFIWIDLEHSYLSLEALMAHIIAIKAAGTSVIVRVPQDDLTFTKKVLEMGVDGIIFPMVKSSEQANRMIDATLYPPYGNRGFGPMNAIGFGFDDAKSYVGNTKDHLCRFIQIEHIDAVDNLEDIIKNEYIDGYIFGPNDLSGSINELCNVFGENTTELIKKSISILKSAGKYIGLSTGDTSKKVLEYWNSMGIDMLSAGADFGMLQQAMLKNRINLEHICKSSTLYQNKIFFTKNNFTADVNCAMLPPQIFDASAADADCYSTKKRKWQSAPSVCKAYGRLFCCFSGDNYGGDEQPNNYNVILMSSDNGASWETLYILDHMDSVRMHEPILWVGPDGIMRHYWAQSYEWWDGRGGVWCINIELRDGSWSHSAPKRLCDGVLATTPISTKDRNIIMPVSIWHRWKGRIHAYPNFGNSSVYLSKDNGETFNYVGGVRDEDSTFDENAVVERSDGSLYMIIRCEKHISYTISNDGGKTWSTPEKLMDHTSSRSYLAKLPSGNYLLVTNNHPEKRTDMTAFISTDECNTWQPKLLLDGKDAVSYPTGCVEEDGRIYVAYDFNRYAEEEIYFASFTEEELLKGKIFEDESFIQKLIVKGENGKKAIKKIYESGNE